MPVPHYLSQIPSYNRVEGISDTADIVTEIATMLVAAGWTSEGGGVYKSPTTAFGRYIKVTLDADDGSNLQIEAEDDLVRTAPIGRLNVVGTVVFDIWCGAGYLAVQNTTDNEWIIVNMLDTFPEDEDAHPNIMAVNAIRDSVGNATSATPLHWSVFDISQSNYTTLSVETVGIMETNGLGVSTAASGKTMIGTRKEWPLFIFGNDNTDFRLRGRITNMVLFCVAGGATVGMKVPVAFDETDTRNFRVLGVTVGRGWRLGILED